MIDKITDILLKKTTKTLFSRYLPFFFLLCSFIIVSGISFFFIDPVKFRKIVFQPIREIIFFQKELGGLTSWGKIEKKIVTPSKKIIIPSVRKGELKIVSDLWVPNGERPVPAILLLHGNSPWGRKNGLIRLLAHEFSEAGWIVLSPDARGFGETADPKNIEDPKAWIVKNDIRRCIDYLSSFPVTDSDCIYVLGHSRGAGHALEGALDDSRVRSLILIGPPRFLGGFKLSFWKRIRFSADRGLIHPISEEVLQARMIKTDISFYAKNQLKKVGHKPILLIDGELEGVENLTFLAKIAKEINPPLTYCTLPNTGHYCGVINLFGSDSIYYRPDLFNNFILIIKDYMDKELSVYYR